MTASFCNVALAVPLRTVFTYGVPESLRELVQAGTRVLVPFRNKSRVGVVTELTEQAPVDTKIRDITKVLDARPALTPKLIELGQWIANYYLAPVGEVFRAMLPPVTEVRTQREILITELGRDVASSLSGGELEHGLTRAQAEFLAKLSERKGPLRAEAASLERLRRQRLIEIRETVLGRSQKRQRVIAWKVGRESTPALLDEKAALVKTQLEERGPLPLAQLVKLASVSRAVIERMLRDGLLEG